MTPTTSASYEVREGKTLVAYLREGKTGGYNITPVKIGGDKLNDLMKAIDQGRLPEGFTKQATAYNKRRDGE
jgi:hypothetical protein